MHNAQLNQMEMYKDNEHRFPFITNLIALQRQPMKLDEANEF